MSHPYEEAKKKKEESSVKIHFLFIRNHKRCNVVLHVLELRLKFAGITLKLERRKRYIFCN